MQHPADQDASAPSGCLSDSQVAAFVERRLDPAAEEQVRAHLCQCSACRALMAAALSGGAQDDATADTDPLPAGAPAGGPAGPGLAAMASVPDEFEGYRLLRPLGRGAMGQVYLGHDTTLDRQVAIKFLTGHHRDDLAHQRFLVEARAIARLNHPNVVGIYRASVLDGRPFLVSEFIAGQSLERCPKPVPWSEALRIGAALSRGLATAHRHGVLHRDIKPANVMLQDDGQVKLLDFGLAKLTGLSGRPRDGEIPPAPTVPDGSGPRDHSISDRGGLVGTPRYMAPEIWAGQPASRRSDVYSLGALLYELCTGQPPHLGPTVEALRELVQRQDARPLSACVSGVAPDFERVVARCLQRDPAARFASGQELLQGLERVRPAGAGPARGPRHRLLAGLLFAAIAGGGAGAVRWSRRPPGQEAAGQAAHPQRPQGIAHQARRGLVILPPENRSGRAAAWIGTTLAEMLRTELATGDQLRIVTGEVVAQMAGDLALSAPPAAAAAGDRLTGGALAKVRAYVAADLLLRGSYQVTGAGEAAVVQLELLLLDTATGAALCRVSDRGSDRELFGLVARTGGRLREQLGLERITPAEASAVRASLPGGPAGPLYAQGLDKLRQNEIPAARALLDQAAALAPGHPLIHWARAELLGTLSARKQEKEEAERAYTLSAGLRLEDRLHIEARYRSARNEVDKALAIQRMLFDFFPDNLEYGLGLMNSQIAANKQQEALDTAAALRRLPAPTNEDPRIDLAEGAVYQTLHDIPGSLRCAEQAARRAQTRGARMDYANARYGAGRALYLAARLPEALSALEEAEHLFGVLGFSVGRARVLGGIGATHLRLGDLAQAIRARGQAVAIYHELGEEQFLPLELVGLAQALRQTGALAPARGHVEEALRVGRRTGLTDEIGSALMGLGAQLLAEGRLAEARRAYEEAILLLLDRGGDNRLGATSGCGLGLALQAAGDLAGARRRYETALHMQDQLGLKADAADSRRLLAALLVEQGRGREAEALAREAVQEFQRDRARDDEAATLAVLARALLLQGRPGAAREMADQARELVGGSQSVRVRLGVTTAWAALQAVPCTAGPVVEARQALAGVIAQARELGLVGERLEATLELGALERRCGPAAAGRAQLLALAREARALGYGLLARKAQAR